jgi:hypothetical protein
VFIQTGESTADDFGVEDDLSGGQGYRTATAVPHFRYVIQAGEQATNTVLVVAKGNF